MRNNKRVFITIFMLLIIIGLVCCFVFFKNKKKNNDNDYKVKEVVNRLLIWSNDNKHCFLNNDTDDCLFDLNKGCTISKNDESIIVCTVDVEDVVGFGLIDSNNKNESINDKEITVYYNKENDTIYSDNNESSNKEDFSDDDNSSTKSQNEEPNVEKDKNDIVVETKSKDKIHFLSTGSSDAIIIESNNHFGLIDSGNPPKNDGTNQSFYDNNTDIVNYMKRIGVKNLDFIIATHSHSDHIGAMTYVANSGFVTSNTIYYYRKYVDTTNDYNNNGFKNNEKKYYENQEYNSKNDYDNWGYYCRSIVSMGSKILGKTYSCKGVNIKVLVNNKKKTINKIISMNSEPKISTFTKSNSGNGGLYEVTNLNLPEISFGNFSIKILNTESVNNDETELSLDGSGKNIAKGENKNSLVELITYKPSGKKIFLAADIGYEDEKRMINKIEKVDIFKTGHHGSFQSNGVDFVASLDPKIAISCTSGSKTGNGVNMSAFCYAEQKGTKFYSTGQAGKDNAIIIDFNKTNYNISVNEPLSICKSINKSGWVNAYGNTYYFDKYNNSNKTAVKGFNTINGAIYYFDDIGRMQIGWLQIKNNWYFFDKKGIMQTGWVEDNSKWYYLNESGIMQTGWVKDNNKSYYLNNSGVMQTDWVQINNNWYYFNKYGVMQTGWVEDNSKWYYLNESGIMQTGWISKGGNWYYLNKYGVMQTGWVYIDNYYYYFIDSGSMKIGILKINGEEYYLRESKDQYGTGPRGSMVFDGCYIIESENRCYNDKGKRTN